MEYFSPRVQHCRGVCARVRERRGNIKSAILTLFRSWRSAKNGNKILWEYCQNGNQKGKYIAKMANTSLINRQKRQLFQTAFEKTLAHFINF